VDFAQTLSNVDPLKIALCGWSLGGYLAPRAASGEPRLAACVADPALPSVADGFRAYVMKLGATRDEAANLGELPAALMERLAQIVANDRKLTWSIAKRGYWVNGASTLREYLASVERYTMDGRIGEIRCPTLFTLAENDTLAAGTQSFFDALRCPKTLIRFTRNQGAGEHCEMRNRSLVNRRVLDWMDEVLG
jgi:pimeloyl-ACP methyl ester carboxylesterase